MLAVFQSPVQCSTGVAVAALSGDEMMMTKV
jgi:hypothetical protein